jgi:hypothetical protein
MTTKDLFLKAIHEKKVVEIAFDSNEKGIVTRKCIPFDYGPSRKYNDKSDRYHFYDLNSPEGKHNLSILPRQLLKITLLDESFEPSTYVTWKPRWIVPRDWGDYS